MKKIVLTIMIMVNLYGWETNTHRAIDRVSITSAETTNLHRFLNDSYLGGQTFNKSEFIMFDGYGKTYFDYIVRGELNGMSALKSKFSTPYTSVDLIEAGTMLEDAQWVHDNEAPWYIPDKLYDKYDQGHGRFMNHFYNAHGWICKSLKCATTDAISWAYDSGGNDYDYMDAMSYFVRGFSEPDTNERRKYQAKMFVSVGHLMNDMNVPAHVRNLGVRN